MSLLPSDSQHPGAKLSSSWLSAFLLQTALLEAFACVGPYKTSILTHKGVLYKYLMHVSLAFIIAYRLFRFRNQFSCFRVSSLLVLYQSLAKRFICTLLLGAGPVVPLPKKVKIFLPPNYYLSVCIFTAVCDTDMYVCFAHSA